jgi:basic membrane protein A and related proteins
MSTRRAHVALAGLALTAMIAGACSGGGDAATNTSDTTSNEPGTTVPVTTSVPTSTSFVPRAAELPTSSLAPLEDDDESPVVRAPIRVAFVYLGSVGDAGWTKRHDDGRKLLERKMAGWVQTAYRENVPEGPESLAVFDELAAGGYDVIIGTSFGYLDSMLEIASRYPDVCFQHASGDKTAANLGTFFGGIEQARYLAGIAAGKATVSGKIGYVAAFPIPEVIRGINAFTLGARSVRPDATVQVRWTSTWFDPELEATAAEELVVGGADIVAQHQDTAAAGEIATGAGAKWIGYNDDMSRFAPTAWLTAPVWNWGPHYIDIAESVLDGQCPTEQFYGGLADGTVGLAPYGDAVDQPTRDQILLTWQAMVDGTVDAFSGPIRDQSGTERIPAGSTASLDDLFSMDYLVEGVLGELPAA